MHEPQPARAPDAPARARGAPGETERHTLAALLLQAQEAERKRIAMDLHDSIGQSLTGFMRNLEMLARQVHAVPPETLKDELEELIPRVRRTIGEVRRIAMNLRPAMLDDLGLLATFSWFFRELEVMHPDLRVACRLDVAEGDIPPLLKTAIFRIVQEAANNVIKHANAQTLAVALLRTRRHLELRISDDGRGFDIDEAVTRARTGRALGLRGMRERVEQSGGSFKLAAAESGVEIRARWPLVPPAA